MADRPTSSMPPSGCRWVLPVLLLPINILIFIPAIVLLSVGYQREASHPLWTATGCMLLLAGMGLAAWTMRLFHTLGQGTAAPWDPPQHLVVAGPYRHMRNPMLTAVFIMQLAEALLLNSWPIFILFIIFVAGNMLYFPLVEEKALEKRFGEAYREYKRNVPRWMPRIRPRPVQ